MAEEDPIELAAKRFVEELERNKREVKQKDVDDVLRQMKVKARKKTSACETQKLCGNGCRARRIGRYEFCLPHTIEFDLKESSANKYVVLVAVEQLWKEVGCLEPEEEEEENDSSVLLKNDYFERFKCEFSKKRKAAAVEEED